MITLLRKIARGQGDIDVVGRTRTWATASGIVLVLSLIGLLGPGLNLGQEFTGGDSYRVTSVSGVTVAEVESALDGFGLEDLKVQILTKRDTGEEEILVRTAHISDQQLFVEVEAAIAAVAGAVDDAGEPDIDEVSIDAVGPTWGRQVSSKALQGLIIFLILVSVYISMRFEPKMAVGALVALFHDLLATAGLYALVGFIVTPATVIALLTLLGYSLYDTVVVFDKIAENSENLTASGHSTYSDMVNASANQMMMRSINTSLSTMLPIGSLLFVGVFIFSADTLKDLALAMFIGTLVGTYSSLFVATPLLAKLKERERRYRGLRQRAEERAARKTPPPRRRVPDEPVAEPTVGAGADTSLLVDDEDAPDAEAPETPAPAPRPPRPVTRASGPGVRPRRRKRGKRRR